MYLRRGIHPLLVSIVGLFCIFYGSICTAQPKRQEFELENTPFYINTVINNWLPHRVVPLCEPIAERGIFYRIIDYTLGVACNHTVFAANFVFSVAALPEDFMRAFGATDGDVEAINFGLMMVGIGEVNQLGKSISMASGAATAAEEVSVASRAIPSRMARVIPAEFAGGIRLGAPSASEVFVTAADDLARITTSEGLAQRLTLIDGKGALIPGPRAVVEFDAVTEGLASPVLRNSPGFVGRGLTAGGAREFVLPNLRLEQLQNVTLRVVP